MIRDVLREGFDDVDDGPPTWDLPNDPDLRDAYLTLVDESHHAGDALRIELERAKGCLYTNDTPKDAVRSTYLAPLAKHELVHVKPGISRVWVYVRPRLI